MNNGLRYWPGVLGPGFCMLSFLFFAQGSGVKRCFCSYTEPRNSRHSQIQLFLLKQLDQNFNCLARSVQYLTRVKAGTSTPTIPCDFTAKSRSADIQGWPQYPRRGSHWKDRVPAPFVVFQVSWKRVNPILGRTWDP